MTKQEIQVIFNTAISLDGRIEGREEFFANRQENYRIKRLRGSVDAIMIDIEHVMKFDPLLDAHELSEEEPWRIVIDNKCDIRHDAKILDYEKVIVVVSADASKSRVKAIGQKKNVNIIRCGKYVVNLRELLRELRGRGIERILVEGIGDLPRRMFKEGFVNEVYVNLCPAIIGGGESFFNKKLEKDIGLKVEGIIQYGDHVILHYTVKSASQLNSLPALNSNLPQS